MADAPGGRVGSVHDRTAEARTELVGESGSASLSRARKHSSSRIRIAPAGLTPLVIIFKSRDVILTKIRPALNLDKHKRRGSGVCDSVFGLPGNDCLFIYAQADLAFAKCDQGFSGDDDPMLAAA